MSSHTHWLQNEQWLAQANMAGSASVGSLFHFWKGARVSDFENYLFMQLHISKQGA